MKLTRRQFACSLGVAPAALSLFNRAVATASASVNILEQRVYDRAGVVPPDSVLRQCGIGRFDRHEGKRHVEFQIHFDSLAERTRAWDRFNSDPEWCALRLGKEVSVRKISFSPVP